MPAGLCHTLVQGRISGGICLLQFSQLLRPERCTRVLVARFLNMPSFKRNQQLISALTTLLLLVFAGGCKGFFVNAPSSITVNPNSQSMGAGAIQAFTATASYQDGTSKNVTTTATWGSSNACAVAVIASGINAGNATAVGSGGAVTITANLSGVSGTATATVATGLTINPCPETASGTLTKVVFSVGGSQTFTATSGGSDVTSQATWTSSNSSFVNFASPSSSAATFPTAGTATITATTSSASGTLMVTVQ
jgi:hypothetical protein